MSSEQPLVSVFMPTYNQEKYVAAAIDSILSQSYPNWELVIGDDCSNDRTWAIISDYQQRDPKRIRAYRNEENAGITANCRILLPRCRGEYVAFFAGDDIFLPEKLSRQVESMVVDRSIVLSYHDVETFDSSTGSTIGYFNHGPGSTVPVDGPAHLVARAVVAQCNLVMAGLSVMARRDAVPLSCYDSRVPIASDWLTWIKVLAGASQDARVVYINRTLARYRRHGANMSHDSRRFYDDFLTTLALTENSYPWLIDEVANAQARVRYSMGIRQILDGDPRLGRRYLLQSAQTRIFSWKWLGWIVASYVPAIRPRKNR